MEGVEGGVGVGGPRHFPVRPGLEAKVEGVGDGGVALDIPAVVVGEAEEGSELVEGVGHGPRLNGLNFGGVGGDAVGRDDVSAEVDLGLCEVAFLDVGIQFVLAEDGEDGGEVVAVFFDSSGVDQNVVEVNNDEGIEVEAEDVVHEALEGGGGVGEAEWDDGELEVAVAGAEGCLLDVGILDSDLVVALAEVDFGEDGGPMQAIEHIVDAGEGVGIFDGDVVEGSVVDAEAETPVLLADEEDGSPVRGSGGSDELAVEEVGELAFEFGELVLRHGIEGAVGGAKAGEEVDGVVDGAGGGVGGGLVSGREDVGEMAEERGEPRGFGWWCGGGGVGKVVEVEGEDLVFADLGFFEGGG